MNVCPLFCDSISGIIILLFDLGFAFPLPLSWRRPVTSLKRAQAAGEWRSLTRQLMQGHFRARLCSLCTWWGNSHAPPPSWCEATFVPGSFFTLLDRCLARSQLLLDGRFFHKTLKRYLRRKSFFREKIHFERKQNTTENFGNALVPKNKNWNCNLDNALVPKKKKNWNTLIIRPYFSPEPFFLAELRSVVVSSSITNNNW